MPLPKSSLLLKVSLLVIIIHGSVLLILLSGIGKADDGSIALVAMCYLPLAVLMCIYGVFKVHNKVASLGLGVVLMAILFMPSFLMAFYVTGGPCYVDERGEGRCVMPTAELLLGLVIGGMSAVPLAMTYHTHRLSQSVGLLKGVAVSLFCAILYLFYWGICRLLIQ